MKTIIIDGTGRDERDSKTKYLANRVIAQLNLTDVEVVDLYNIEVPFVTKEIIESWSTTNNDTQALKLLNQFEAADQLIFIYPTWNWSVPAIVRAYMDLVIISSRTFGYDNQGKIEGYLTAKKAILISTTGGKSYKPLWAAFKHAQDGDNYMKQVLRTMGIANVISYSIDNTAYDFNDANGKFDKLQYAKRVDRIVAQIEPQ